MSTPATISAAIDSAIEAIAVSGLGLSGTGQVYDYLFIDHDLQTPQEYLIDSAASGSPIHAVGSEVLFEDDPWFRTASGEQNGSNRTYLITIEVYRARSAGTAAVMAECLSIINALAGIDWNALNCEELTPITPQKRFDTVPGVASNAGVLVGVMEFSCKELHPSYE